MNGIMANRKVKKLLGDSAMAWKKNDGVCVVGKVNSHGGITVWGDGKSYEEALENATQQILIRR